MICPICKKSLILNEKTYRCENNHCFDKAKQGYVNLFMGSSVKSGDDKQMILARKEFLEKNYYKNISDQLNNLVLGISDENMNIVDCGCGEGYYTSNLKKYLDKNIEKLSIYGFDISKPAIIEASKSYKNINFFVATISNIPLEDISIDLGVLMFTKNYPDDLQRIIKDDGKIIVVSSGENHLLEMRKIIFDDVRIEAYDPNVDLNNYFEKIDRLNLNYQVEIIGNRDIINLFNMTPYKWKTKKEKFQELKSYDRLEITVDINFDIFRKR